jgi:histidinol-phosphatase (PHP family)
MKWTNYHSHTHYSDGKGSAELFIESAIKNGMYAYGFSCHSPVPFETGWNMKFEKLMAYLHELSHCKEKYRNQIKLFTGLEIDYVKDIIGQGQFKNFNLDYTIGGIHFLGFFPDGSPWDFDGGREWFQKGLNGLFDGDIKKLVAFYYQQVSEMVTLHKTDVLAHFDLIKKSNAGNFFFNEKDTWYRDIAYGALDAVAKSGIIMEVNTRGVLKKLSEEFYPSNFILKRAKELKIPVCLSADTHNPADTMALLPEARDVLYALGFRSVHILDENGWNPVGIMDGF